MGKTTGFLEYELIDRGYEPVADRVQHYREFYTPLPDDELQRQGARCMDCGIPYCHDGCPVNNIIPDWNDLVYRQEWQRASEVLHSTNNFPEFTGRICPAPCEAACTLNIIDQPVTIKTIECAIVDRAWEEGWIRPLPPIAKTGKSVAVIGSGPAGLASAQQLARAGHDVTVFEKNAKPGGLLRYGIPDFKMEKHLIDRRIQQMESEGVTFRPNSHIGVDTSIKELHDQFDALVLAGGAELPRGLPIPGRDLDGVHFAMDFLTPQNCRVSGEQITDNVEIMATDKNVIVIGGGDTGSDCVGTSFRHGAASVTQLEILPKPPEHENKDLTWPLWPLKLRTSSSHQEGVERDWSVTTTNFVEENGKLSGLNCVRVEWVPGDDGRMQMKEIEGSAFELKAELVLLAMGFVHPVHEGMIEDLGVELDERGNVQASTDAYQTSISNVFAAGDMRRGQSLVVWAIREGRQCARAVDEFLQGVSDLPR